MSLKSEAVEMTSLSLQAGGMDPREAKKIAKQIVKQAGSKQVEQGTRNIPPNAAELVLSGASFHVFPADYGKQLAEEGVTEDDIRWWWGLPDFMRWVMFCWEEHLAMVAFLDGLQKGLDSEAATRKMTKQMALYRYGLSYEKPPVFVGDNRRLPYEIKDRVDMHIEKRIKQDQEGFKREFESATSFNAYIRAKVTAGEL